MPLTSSDTPGEKARGAADEALAKPAVEIKKDKHQLGPDVGHAHPHFARAFQTITALRDSFEVGSDAYKAVDGALKALADAVHKIPKESKEDREAREEAEEEAKKPQ